MSKSAASPTARVEGARPVHACEQPSKHLTGRTGKTPGGPAFPPANLLQHPYLPALRRIPAPGFPSLALDLLAPLPLRRFATAVVAAARRCHARWTLPAPLASPPIFLFSPFRYNSTASYYIP
jgi:hypothetical protein